MKICVLSENLTYQRGLVCEHGLSVLIEEDGKRWLFDTGQTGIFVKNACAMGISLEPLDGIILSHGHYDHCGGIETLMKQLKDPVPVYVRKRAFEAKFADKKGPEKEEIGIPWKEESCGSLVPVEEKKKKLSQGIWLIGDVPYTPGLEGPSPGMFVLSSGQFEEDRMSDEQMLVFETPKGLSVFAGCSHPGIINCLHYVREQFPGKKIFSLLAGMHLMHADQKKISWTLAQIKEYGVEVLMPVHCTGMNAIVQIQQQYPGQFQKVHCGSVIEL